MGKLIGMFVEAIMGNNLRNALNMPAQLCLSVRAPVDDGNTVTDQNYQNQGHTGAENSNQRSDSIKAGDKRPPTLPHRKQMENIATMFSTNCVKNCENYVYDLKSFYIRKLEHLENLVPRR